jgi:hypothetical protein
MELHPLLPKEHQSRPTYYAKWSSCESDPRHSGFVAYLPVVPGEARVRRHYLRLESY